MCDFCQTSELHIKILCISHTSLFQVTVFAHKQLPWKKLGISSISMVRAATVLVSCTHNNFSAVFFGGQIIIQVQILA